MKPACFDSMEQWAAWLAAARMAPPPQRDGYCADCTPEYKDAMVRAARCEHPRTEFFEEDGDVRGVRYGGQE